MIAEEKRFDLGGRELILRSPQEDEAQMLIDYLKITNGETRFLISEPEEITLSPEDEQNFIRQRNASPDGLLLLGFLDGEYVGNCCFNGFGKMRLRHRASMGIALYQKFTGLGIGPIMLEALFSAARARGFEQMELEVVAGNRRAISLYRKMGFEIYGTFPNAMKYRDGTSADVFWMMKRL